MQDATEWRDKLLELAVEFDDNLMEKYFDNPSLITVNEIKAAIRKGTLSMSIFPIVCGSSFKNKGVQPMLDAICAYLPSPVDNPIISGNAVNSNEIIEFKSDENEPLCAIMFKIATDKFVGKLCYVRVYSGKIKSGEIVYIPRTGKKMRINKLMQMHSNEQKQIDELCAGDIGAVVGLSEIRTGDS